MTLCPDCEQEIPGDRDAFVAHREQEHPPVGVHTLYVEGIESEEVVYGQKE